MKRFKSWQITAGQIMDELFGGLILNGPLIINQGAAFLKTGAILTYGPVINIDASLGNLFIVTITDGVAFTFAAPTNPPSGASTQRITILARNTSGGAHGAGTWNAAFKALAFPAIATANNRTFSFNWNGANWIQEVYTADVPN
jgi:hypothetical protein